MRAATTPSRAGARTRQIGVATALAFLLGCGSRETPPPAAPETPAATSTAATPARAAPVQIEMKNVRLHLDVGIVLDVRHLRGEMLSRSHEPPVFDDPRSYTLRIATGDLGMDMTSLGNLMNHHVFAYEDAPPTLSSSRAIRRTRQPRA